MLRSATAVAATASQLYIPRSVLRRRGRRLSGGQKTVGAHWPNDDAVPGRLFDVDGTLIDTMPKFFPSWTMAGMHFGLTMTEAAFYSYAGLPLPEIVRRMHREQRGGEASEEFIAKFLRAKLAAHKEYEAATGHPPAIECVVQLAREAVARGIPVAVATSGTREVVEEHLAHCGLADLFN